PERGRRIRCEILTTEVQERHVGRYRGAETLRDVAVHEIPENAVADAAVRNGAQLRRHRLQLERGRGVGLELDRHRIQAGEPTDGPRHVSVGDYVLATVAFEIQTQGRAARPFETGRGERCNQRVR